MFYKAFAGAWFAKALFFCLKIFLKKVSNFALSRGYLMGGENVEQVRKKWTIKKQTSRDRFYSIMGGLNYVKIIQIYK